MSSHRKDEAFIQAVSELAKAETERTGDKVSDAVVIRTLAVKSGGFYTAKRKHLARRIKQLNMEEKTNGGSEGRAS